MSNEKCPACGQETSKVWGVGINDLSKHIAKSADHEKRWLKNNPNRSTPHLDYLLGKKAEDKGKSVNISEIKKAVKDIVWMARRYADGRRTYAPSMFNDAYKTLVKELGDIERANDPDNAPDRIKNWPYATDGDFPSLTEEGR